MVIILTMFVTEVFAFDYSSFGLMMILVFYYTRNTRYGLWIQIVLLFVINTYLVPAYYVPLFG